MSVVAGRQFPTILCAVLSAYAESEVKVSHHHTFEEGAEDSDLQSSMFQPPQEAEVLMSALHQSHRVAAE